MSESDWQRAGLEKLAPDQLSVVDAALIRYIARMEMRLAREALETAPANPTTAATASFGKPEKNERSLWERFGLPSLNSDWRDLPALKAKVVRWRGANRFVLDNGQVWEGLQSIPFELVGREIAIEPRPRGQYALVVEGHSSALRVLRVE